MKAAGSWFPRLDAERDVAGESSFVGGTVIAFSAALRAETTQPASAVSDRGPGDVVRFSAGAPVSSANVNIGERFVGPAKAGRSERFRTLALVTLSGALHAAVFVFFWREPAPLASIGVEVVSIELVLGADTPAGVASTPGSGPVEAAASDSPQNPDQQPADRAQADPEQHNDRVPEPSTETPPQEAASAPVAQAEPVSQELTVASIDQQPEPKTATVVPEHMPTPPVQHMEPVREEAEPARMEVLTPSADHALAKPSPPKEEPRRPEKQSKPNRSREAQKKPAREATAKKERERADRNRTSKSARASQSASASSGVGLGRSDRDANYAGMVSAHLRRHQRYPPDARSAGQQGTATVTFSLDGGGRVTAARLVRGSGNASIDQEVSAMVRRASPFPAPPTGRSASFTVPVSFRLN